MNDARKCQELLYRLLMLRAQLAVLNLSTKTIDDTIKYLQDTHQ